MRKETVICDQCGGGVQSILQFIPLISGTCVAGIPTKRDFCREECLRDWLNEHLPYEPPKASPDSAVDPGEGYRRLKIGEKIQETDEFWKDNKGPWVRGKYPLHKEVTMDEFHLPHRRKVEPGALSEPDEVGVWETRRHGGSGQWLRIDVDFGERGLRAGTPQANDLISDWKAAGWNQWWRVKAEPEPT